MLPFQRTSRFLSLTALGVLLLAACSPELFTTSNETPAFKKGPKAFQGGCNGSGDGVSSHEMTHWPLKHSAIGSGAEDGWLYLTGGKRNSAFGLCSEPDEPVAGITVEFAESEGYPRGGDFVAILRNDTGPFIRLGVRTGANGGVQGFFDVFAELPLRAMVRRNGELVRTVNGTGHVVFPLPMGFRLTGWSNNQDRATLSGLDNANNNWMVSIAGGGTDNANIWSVTQRFKDYNDRRFHIHINPFQ